MKRLIILVFTALFFCVCGAEGVYDALDMSLSRDSVEALYPQLTPEGVYFRVDDALLCFFESGRLQAKCRAFENVADIAAETDASFDSVLGLKQGAKLERLTGVLGEGTEIMLISIADEENPGSRMVLAWRDASGRVLEALFETDNGSWVLFALAQI